MEIGIRMVVKAITARHLPEVGIPVQLQRKVVLIVEQIAILSRPAKKFVNRV